MDSLNVYKKLLIVYKNTAPNFTRKKLMLIFTRTWSSASKLLPCTFLYLSEFELHFRTEFLNLCTYLSVKNLSQLHSKTLRYKSLWGNKYVQHILLF